MRILSGFVHQGTPADVQSVMVDGEWLMRDDELLTLDESGIVAEAEVVGRRAWGRLLEEFPDAELPFSLDTRQP
jgi:cytosine/adenosine deaminase-related metal-dependent hydrolase